MPAADSPHRTLPRRLAAASVALITAAALALTGTSVATAAGVDTGSITGVVTGEAEAPLDNVSIQLFRYDADYDPTQQDGPWTLTDVFVRTDANGAYAIDGLEPADYAVAVFPQSNNAQYLYEYWDGAREVEDATPVTVAAGDTVEVNPTLEVGASISGTVVDGEGNPVESVYVFAYTAGDFTATRGSGVTDANGVYTIQGLPAGEHVVRADPQWFTSDFPYLAEFWENARDMADATVIPTVLGEVFTGADFELELGAVVSGTVTDTSANAVEGATVTLYQLSEWGWNRAATATTDATGGYEIDSVDIGEYIVGFAAHDSGLGQQYFSGAADQKTATRLEFGPGVIRDDIDAQLAVGGSLTGTLTLPTEDGVAPAANAYVDVLRDVGNDEWETITYVTTNADGVYEVSGLAPGVYTLRTSGPSGGNWAYEYLGEVYYPEEATGVEVVAGETASGHDIELSPGVSIAGQLLDDAGRPAPSASVQITYERSPGEWATPPAVGGAGDHFSYQASGLPPGRYLVRFFDASGDARPYAEQYWENAATREEATILDAAEGGTFTGISSSLTRSTPAPTIDGVAQVGQTLTAAPGEWGAGVEVQYQWLADGVAIEGATADEFAPTDAQVGATLSVEVTAGATGAEPEVVRSAETAAVLGYFADVTATTTYAADIAWASEFIDGTVGADGVRRFAPAANATRADAVVALYRLLGSPEVDITGPPTFSDVTDDSELRSAVEYLADQRIVLGAGGSFLPTVTLSRQHQAAFLFRAADTSGFTPPTTASFRDVPVGSSFFRAIEWFAAEEITSVSSTFKPGSTVTRAHVAVFLHRWAASQGLV